MTFLASSVKHFNEAAPPRYHHEELTFLELTERGKRLLLAVYARQTPCSMRLLFCAVRNYCVIRQEMVFKTSPSFAAVANAP